MVADYDEDLWTDKAVAPIPPIRQQEKIQCCDDHEEDDDDDDDDEIRIQL